MKIKIEKKALVLGVQRVQGAVSETQLANIALKASGNTLTISATDQSIAIYCWLDCDVISEGLAFLPAKIVSGLVRELPESLIQLSLKGPFFLVEAGLNNEFSMKLPLVEGQQWYDPPASKYSFWAQVPALNLSYIIEQTQFCVDPNSTKAYGAVGYLHRHENALRLVGSDGFRLSYSQSTTELAEQFLKQGVCLTKKALLELLKMCSQGYENIEIAISEEASNMRAKVMGYEIYIALSSVHYPNYLAALQGKDNSAASIRMNKDLIQTVTKRVSLAAGKTKLMQFSLQDKSLTLKARDSGSTEGIERLDVEESYEGPKLNLTVNSKFLSDIFAAMSSEGLKMLFRDEENPIMFIPEQEPIGCQSLHVLVPIKESE